MLNTCSAGYIQHVVDSLLQDDDELQSMLSPQPAPLRAFYIYQSKMVSAKTTWAWSLLQGLCLKGHDSVLKAENYVCVELRRLNDT